jgi:hypothetical protein
MFVIFILWMKSQGYSLFQNAEIIFYWFVSSKPELIYLP